MPYIGNCCCWFTVRGFLKLEKDEWIKRMEHNFHKVHPGEVTESQRKAWQKSFDVLQQTLGEMPADWNKLTLIFEYVLPNHRPGTELMLYDAGVRPDVLLLTEKTVVVLEFKDHANDYIGSRRQALKYRRRIQNYHAESKGMNKKCLLVLMDTSDYVHKHHKITTCSADMLKKCLTDVLGESPKYHQNTQRWIASAFEP